MTDVPMIPTLINQRWTLLLPEHRAARAEWWDGWEKERFAAMYDTIKPGDIVYDVGAEECDFAGLFATWTEPACRACRFPMGAHTTESLDPAYQREGHGNGGVVLFEPNDLVWPNGKAIFEANGLHEPLATFAGFAGDETRIGKAGELKMQAGWPPCADGPVIGDHSFANLWERPDIPAVTIDAAVQMCGYVPDVITIDTEGSELRVLKGAECTLREERPIVFVSVHPDFMWEGYQDTDTLLYAFMNDCGYDKELLAVDHETHVMFTPR